MAVRIVQFFMILFLGLNGQVQARLRFNDDLLFKKNGWRSPGNQIWGPRVKNVKTIQDTIDPAVDQFFNQVTAKRLECQKKCPVPARTQNKKNAHDIANQALRKRDACLDLCGQYNINDLDQVIEEAWAGYLKESDKQADAKEKSIFGNDA